MPPRSRLARLEHLAAQAIPEPVDSSWTQHPAVAPILAELATIPLPPPPPCDNPMRRSTEAIAAALGNPKVREAMCRLAGVMCVPEFPTTWIPNFARKPTR
ncbi:MAG: hypothetical protein U0744_16095 [Gemmataceae bacterium]